MAGRYLVTGVQLGMLLAIDDKKEREDILNKIMKDQFIGTSENSIENDCNEHKLIPAALVEAKFVHPNHGYPADKAMAKRYLEIGKSYAVKKIEIGDFNTNVWLMEYPDKCFNSVLFEFNKEIFKNENTM